MDDDNKSRGFGYLKFESKESVDKCLNEITALANVGKKITVLDKEVVAVELRPVLFSVLMRIETI